MNRNASHNVVGRDYSRVDMDEEFRIVKTAILDSEYLIGEVQDVPDPRQFQIIQNNF